MTNGRKADKGTVVVAFIMSLLLGSLLYAALATSTPDGVTVVPVSNTTKTPAAGGNANFTGNSSTARNTAGGFIFNISITGATQNTRWKAFVGDANGKLTLQDSVGYTIYDWTLSTVTGEVYATRFSGNVNWSGIGCAYLNITEAENRLLNHSSSDDNISATFSTVNNKAMVVGTKSIAANSCFTLNTFINGSANSLDNFEEVVLHDQNSTNLYNGTTGSFGNIVYAETLENNALGYDNSSTHDFQILVPERGENGWTSALAYYFYLELS